VAEFEPPAVSWDGPPHADPTSGTKRRTTKRIMMIVAEELGKTYRSGGRPLEVLSGVELQVEAQEVVAVLGPSGSGKTTLLGLLAGLDEPTSGRVRLDGTDLAALTEDERAVFRARKVGFVFQTFHLLPTLTALENVLVPLELLGRVPADASTGEGDGGRNAAKPMEARARDLLERVGLGDRLDHYPSQLSGGEQQRVALARAFAHRPRILFADEPTGNLDAGTGARVVELLEELNREARTTLVLVTHDLSLARRAGRVVRLEGGRVVADGPPEPARESSPEPGP
jgi:putative ABC transport system ATP-binding protein